MKRSARLTENQENMPVDREEEVDDVLQEDEEEQPQRKRARHSTQSINPTIAGLSQQNPNVFQQVHPLQGGGSFQAPSRRPAAPTHNGEGAPAMQGARARPQQAMQRVPGQLAWRREALAGQLKKIRLENFMCHQCFEMEFGPHVTLVSGTNGSGKSAVMQALQVSLGVSARTTGRGQNLAHFIRTGATDARIVVTICNKGPDAFEHKLFGDSIIVERRIGPSSGYSMKSHEGRVVPRKEMQDAMKDHFSIDAANPLTIVTQDMARCFLSGAKDDDRKKYDMYMEGTLLYKIQEHLSEANYSLQQAKHCVLKVKKENQELQSQLKELTNKLSQIQDLDMQADLLLQIEQNRAWALVKTSADEIALCEDQLDAVPEMKEQLQQEIESAESQRLAAQQQIQAVHDEMVRFQEVNQAAKVGLNEAKKLWKAALQARRNVESAVDGLKKGLENATNDHTHFQEVMFRGTDSEKVEQAKAKLKEFDIRINTLKASADEHQQEFARHRMEHNTLTEQRQHLLARIKDLSQTVVSSKANISNLEREKTDLQQSSGNRAMPFGGAAVCQLLALIARNRRSFQYQPIGPVGSHLSIADSKWSISIDSSIGRILGHFICFSKQDAELLRHLAQQANAHVTVLQTRPGVGLHNITRTPKAGFTTVLDMLVVTESNTAIANPIINMLVDIAKVEATVLVETMDEGRDVAYHAAAGTGFSAIDINGTSFKGGQVIVIKGRDRNSRPPSLGMDNRQQVQQLVDLIVKERTSLQAMEEELNDLKQNYQALEVRIKEVDRLSHAAQEKKKAAMRGLSHTSTEQQALLPEINVENEDARLAAATETLQELQVGVAKAQVDLGEKQHELDAAKQREKELEDVYAKLKDQVLADKADFSSYNDQMNRAATAEGEAALEVDKKKAELQKLMEEEEEWKQLRADVIAALPILTEQAEAVCTKEDACRDEPKLRAYMLERRLKERERDRAAYARMSEEERGQFEEESMAWDLLDAEYKRLSSNRKEREKALGGSKEQLEAEYKALNKKVAKKTADHAIIKNNQNALIESHKSRLKTLQSLRDNVEKTCNERFHMYMVRRGHLGRINVDHEEKLVRIEVKVKSLSDPDARWVKDLKQLSGGERSYTTVAFLLALGQWCESSFRCLDEFDVFMDAINRRIAVETLLENALELTDKQYVLLTPQDIQAVEDVRQLLEKKKRIEIPDTFIKTVQMQPART